MKNWENHSNKIIHLEKGLSRHEVIFVNWNDKVYVFKNLHVRLAKREYEILRKAEKLAFQCVIPVGWGRINLNEENNVDYDSGIIITEYLQNSLPFRSLFNDKNLERYRIRLQDAIAGLLVSLHIVGLFWGDCSLSNVLFRRDAGELQAFLVDAETSNFYPIISDATRELDLEIMKENITGDLLDISVLHELPDALDIYSVGDIIEKKYNQLWEEISESFIIKKSENYKIQERIRKLNQIGFSVDEIVLFPTSKQDEVQFKTIVTDKNYYQNLLHSITGILARENQARHIMNEIQEIKADLSRKHNNSLTLGAAAFRWKKDIYEVYINRLSDHFEYLADPIENYCQILEHKWFLSEKAQKDVGLELAFKDYLEKKLKKEIVY
ncbi:MAG: hypothetical protein HeimC3_08010 [Candidatus Heimdallarchaeota archaeon LC_3]|nr:MAG: hypothetical protein HeimC3_08010 [Candidatus Heimdallarchaeota archaeon LC_3]